MARRITGIPGHNKGSGKKQAKKKDSGVGRKKITHKTEEVCKFGKGKNICKKKLTTKKELKSGYCRNHEKEVKEAAKEKVKNQRSKKKSTPKKSTAKKKTPIKKASPKKKTTRKVGSKKRIQIMGMASSAFIRACCKLGLTKDQAKAACQRHLKKDDNMPTDNSFRTQFDYAKHGRAEIPTLTKDLKAIIIKFKK